MWIIEPLINKWIYDLLQESVVDTIMAYSDNGDIQTAAIIALVFYDMLDSNKY